MDSQLQNDSNSAHNKEQKQKKKHIKKFKNHRLDIAKSIIKMYSAVAAAGDDCDSRLLSGFLTEPPNYTAQTPTENKDQSYIRDNIRVIVRIRPKNEAERKNKEAKTILKSIDNRTVAFDQKKQTILFNLQSYDRKPNRDLLFTFDHVFSKGHSNVEIFDNALKSIIDHVILGFNCSVFAYGATGSGKTYTMLGSTENPGLTFLMAKELSKRIKEIANEYESEILVSYLEVYNETIKDLLYPSGQLSIREDGINGVTVPNLTLHKIKDTIDLLRMLSRGNNARTQHPTDHNAESSRSHAVFQVFLTLRKRITHQSLNYKMAKAKLVMVDLAGSERGSSYNPIDNKERCRDGGSINKSLLALGNCINALADGKKHIPYRDSKLTRLLKDSLGGNCKTVMIANVCPTVLNYEDSYNTLKYADRAKKIRIASKKNVATVKSCYPSMKYYGPLVGELEREIIKLKALLQFEKERNMELKKVTCSQVSSFVSIDGATHDPDNLENFMQLLGQKKKLEEAHVVASVAAKGGEWKMMWQKWRLDSLSILGKEKTEKKEGFIQKMKSKYENLRIEYECCAEKVHLAKRLVDFNDKEIDLMEKNFLNTWKKDDPFLTVTLREFLYYKTLEREVEAHKQIENFHQQMSSNMLDELLRVEVLLSDNLKVSQDLQKLLQKHGIKGKESNYNEIIRRICSTKDIDLSKRKFPAREIIKKMLEMIESPIVVYDSSFALSSQVSPKADGNVTVAYCETPCPQKHIENNEVIATAVTQNTSESSTDNDEENDSEYDSESQDSEDGDGDLLDIGKAQEEKPDTPNSSGSSIVPINNIRPESVVTNTSSDEESNQSDIAKAPEKVQTELQRYENKSFHGITHKQSQVRGNWESNLLERCSSRRNDFLRSPFHPEPKSGDNKWLEPGPTVWDSPKELKAVQSVEKSPAVLTLYKAKDLTVKVMQPKVEYYKKNPPRPGLALKPKIEKPRDRESNYNNPSYSKSQVYNTGSDSSIEVQQRPRVPRKKRHRTPNPHQQNSNSARPWKLSKSPKNDLVKIPKSSPSEPVGVLQSESPREERQLHQSKRNISLAGEPEIMPHHTETDGPSNSIQAEILAKFLEDRNKYGDQESSQTQINDFLSAESARKPKIRKPKKKSSSRLPNFLPDSSQLQKPPFSELSFTISNDSCDKEGTYPISGRELYRCHPTPRPTWMMHNELPSETAMAHSPLESYYDHSDDEFIMTDDNVNHLGKQEAISLNSTRKNNPDIESSGWKAKSKNKHSEKKKNNYASSPSDLLVNVPPGYEYSRSSFFYNSKR